MSLFKKLFTKAKPTVLKLSDKEQPTYTANQPSEQGGTYDMYPEGTSAIPSLNAEELSELLEYQSRRYAKNLEI